MQILKTDLKHDLLTVRPETTNDLWLLEQMITPETLVSGKTLRTIKIDQGERATKVKKSIFVKLTAEKIEFNEAGNQLRVSGKIIESSEGEHGYHAFEIVPDMTVTLEKQWRQYEIARLKAARFKHPTVLLCVLDDSEADVALLTERLAPLCTIPGVSGKTMGAESSERYFTEILAVLRQHDAQHIIVAGPGFAKENFLAFVQEHDRILAGKIVTDALAHTGTTGIQEVLRKGIVERIVKHSEIAEQTRLVDEFFVRIAQEHKVAYGISRVIEAVAAGAVETLLLSAAHVRSHEKLMQQCESMNGSVKIIDTNHAAGERFLQFGGFGALLRYRIE